jgi:transposase-like protein
MPIKGDTKTPARKIEEAVKRHLDGGESVAALAKKYKVTRQTVYLWIEAYKKRVMERLERTGVSKTDLEKTAKAELIAQNEILQAEVRKLRDRLVALMVKHNEIP